MLNKVFANMDDEEIARIIKLAKETEPFEKKLARWRACSHTSVAPTQYNNGFGYQFECSDCGKSNTCSDMEYFIIKQMQERIARLEEALANFLIH